MKERIVIEKTKEFRPHPALRDGVNCIDTKYCKYEKVPETFEELKELCKGVKEVTITEEGHINVDFVYFTEKGEIYAYVEGVLTSSIFLPVSKDRIPQQMWQIIKNLIGEE